MTLTIGMIAKEGFVIASDSRMSSSHFLSDTVEKIFELSDKVAVGIAGDGNLASHLFDIIKKEKKLKLDSGIHDIAEQLRTELAQAYDKYYPNTPCAERMELQVLLAGYTLDSPQVAHLYLLSSDDNFIPRQSPSGHNSIGVSHVSQYILNRIYEKGKISSEQAARLSVFCIKETSSQTKSVGGPIKVGTFSEKSKFALLPNAVIGKMFSECSKMQDGHKNKFYPEDATGSELSKK